MTWTQEMGRRILACTGEEFEGPIAASMTSTPRAACTARTGSARRFVVREGRIVSLEPSNMPARRVRMVERKGHRTPSRIRSGRRCQRRS